MDDARRRLEREAAARPGDVEAARRLDAALARAGDREALRARYEVKFACALRYEDLRPGDGPLERRCDRCRRAVHLARTTAELAEHVAAGRCVAIQRRALPVGLDALARDPRLHSAADPARPCVVPMDLPWVDLDRQVPATEVLWVVSPTAARSLRVVPIARDGGDLLVATDRPSNDLAADLAHQLGLRVHLALTDAAGLTRALERHYQLRDDSVAFMGDLDVSVTDSAVDSADD